MIITCCVCTHCRSVFYVWEDIYCCWLLRLNWKIFCCPRLIANLKSRKQSAVDFPLLVSCTKSFIASLQSNRWSLRNWQLLFTGKTWSSDSTVESWRECVSAYVGVLVCVCACACACKCVYVWLHVHVHRWYLYGWCVILPLVYVYRCSCCFCGHLVAFSILFSGSNW